MSTTNHQTVYQALATHQQTLVNTTLLSQFASDPNRFQQYSLQAAGLLFDFSKQHINQQTLPLLLQLAQTCELESARTRLFAGDIMNTSEQRPALHMLWRWSEQATFPTAAIKQTIKQTTTQLNNVSQAIRNSDITGIDGESFTDIIHIGVGGSSTGCKLLYDVLKRADSHRVRIHFVETLDASQLYTVLDHCHPATTAIVIASKTFTTVETQHNATLAIDWLVSQLPAHSKPALINTHCFAITANIEKAHALGIDPQYVFRLPDWVGGRYCIWSAMRFSLIVSVGTHCFDAFLAGAYAMDQHFLTAPLATNMPVIHGLLRIWLRHFWQQPYYAVLPYAHDLRKLPTYLQQLDTESNGKSVHHDGTPVNNATAPLLWGSGETQAQHSIHQWLHQGTDGCPIDFITCARFELNSHAQQTASAMFAHCLSQSLSLMQGISQAACQQQLIDKGLSTTDAEQLSQHQMLPGNRVSNTIILPSLNANTLGALLALYEHSTFVQSVILQINPFDQWGVEQGKHLAQQLQTLLTEPTINKQDIDASTHGLIEFYQQHCHTK